MSRCFPFPPPGYDKKARPDEDNLLEKEKQKEKKQKKEKKDKNKKDKEKKDKEGKQIKGKESGEERRRERKDRKERHRHKKDKNKEKEKKRLCEDKFKFTAGLPECSTVDNPGSGCTQSDETSDIKFLVESGKRIRDDDKTTKNLVVKKMNITGKVYYEYPENVGLRKNENSDGNAMLTDKRTNYRKVFGQSNSSNVRATENGTVQNFVVGQQRKVEGVAGLVGKNVEKRTVHNKIDEHNSFGSRRDGSDERYQDGTKKSSAVRKSEKEPNKEQLPIAREKSRHVCNDSNTESSPLPNESNKNSNLGKRKEIRMNGTLHDDESRLSKLQKPLSCAKEVLESGKYLKLSETLTKADDDKVGLAHPIPKNGVVHRALTTAGEHSMIGQSKVDDKVSNKVSSSRSNSENGRTLEILIAGSVLASGCDGRNSIMHKVDDEIGLRNLQNRAVHKADTLTGHEVIAHPKVDNKEHKINGLVKDRRPKGSSTKPSSSTVKQKYPKPPHPDFKYLSKLLVVPNIEWSGFDEQEWLLGSKANPSSSRFKETKETKQAGQVWDKTLRLESADITALPYVIPF